MVEPTKLKSRFCISADRWSDNSVRAGTWVRCVQRLRIGLPATNDQKKASRLPNSLITASAARALRRAEKNFEAIANQTGIQQQLFQRRIRHARHARDVETMKCTPVCFAFVQHRAPAQSRLRAFEYKEFK